MAHVRQSKDGSVSELNLAIDGEAEEIAASVDEPVVTDALGLAPVAHAATDALAAAGSVRALDRRREGELAVRSVAVAAAGGVVVGAASVALLKVAARQRKSGSLLRRAKRRDDVLGSRSFLIDVHLLKQGR